MQGAAAGGELVSPIRGVQPDHRGVPAGDLKLCVPCVFVVDAGSWVCLCGSQEPPPRGGGPAMLCAAAPAVAAVSPQWGKLLVDNSYIYVCSCPGRG